MNCQLCLNTTHNDIDCPIYSYIIHENYPHIYKFIKPKFQYIVEKFNKVIIPSYLVLYIGMGHLLYVKKENNKFSFLTIDAIDYDNQLVEDFIQGFEKMFT